MSTDVYSNQIAHLATESSVSVYPTGWNCALRRAPEFDIRTVSLQLPPPRVITIPMGRPSLHTRSYFFPTPFDPIISKPTTESSSTSTTETTAKDTAYSEDIHVADHENHSEDGFWTTRAESGSVATGSVKTETSAIAPWEDGAELFPGVTWVRPPHDVIRLEDRLHYLLQPSLQQVFASRALTCPFRPFAYQFEGIAFLYAREMAMLADEMGLGKTMQAILAIRLLLHAGEVRSVLLICPKPLVSNWYREFTCWAPEIPVQVVEGDQARRHWQWQLENIPVRIANYELVTRDRELFEGDEETGGGTSGKKRRKKKSTKDFAASTDSLSHYGDSEQDDESEKKPLEFDLVMLDESQRIKNRNNTTSQVVRSVRRRRSWALTGTPVENSPEDLVGIFEFLSPGFLSSDMKPRKMGETVSDYVIRRTKDQVLTDMPPKLYRDANLELLPEQKESYARATDEGVVHLTEMGESVTIHHVLELVTRLKQICNFDPLTGASVKSERLEADLEEIAGSGRKALIFSQWVQTLDRLEQNLQRFNPLSYHGRIPAKKRDAVIQEFKNDPKRHLLLMSYGAGGVGLNLQFAQYVFLFDRWWNPAMEDQAINRAHRIGAAGQVTVTRFLISDTIEERIDKILQEKRELFDTIFSETAKPRKLGLTHQEIFGLFNLKLPQAS